MNRQQLNKFCPTHGNYVDVRDMEMGCPSCMEEVNPFAPVATTQWDSTQLADDCREDAEADKEERS